MNSKLAVLLIFLCVSPSRGAMDFNGTTQYTDFPSPGITTTFTISLWVYSDQDQVNGFPRMFDFFDSAYRFAVAVGDPVYNDHIAVFDGSSWNDTSYIFPNTVWKHVTVTYNGTTFTLYVDGASVYSPALTINVNSAPFNLATDRGAHSDSWNGKFDDLRIYNRVLSTTEIESLALSRSRLLLTDGLVAWWNLDDGADGALASGVTVLDRSGNGKTGTTTNSPAWMASNWINYP